MKRIKKIGVLLLVAGMALSLCSAAAETSEKPVTLSDEPWVFPVQPGTPEWRKLSVRQRLESCQIPEEVIKGMSTDALLETVLHNPYIIDIMAYSTLEQGIERTSLKIPALKELLERSNVRLAIRRYESENKAAKSTVISETLLTAFLHRISLYLDLEELEAQLQAAGQLPDCPPAMIERYLMDIIQGRDMTEWEAQLQFAEQPPVYSPTWTGAYVYTPMGTAVYAYKDLT